MVDDYKTKVESDPNRALPSAITAMPENDAQSAYYYNAYKVLRRTWQPAMGAEPVPLSEITNYCTFLDDDDPEMFIEVITAADSAYMTHARKKAG